MRVELPAGYGAVHPAVIAAVAAAAAAVVRVEEGVDGAAPLRPPPALCVGMVIRVVYRADGVDGPQEMERN